MEYTNSMEYTNLSSQIVFLKDADIVNDMSANTISSNHVLSNGIPSYDLFRKHYNIISTDISNISDDVEYLLSVDKKAMVYNATLLSTNTITNSRLTTFLEDNFHDPNFKFKHGWMYHLSVGQILSDATNKWDYIGENDYFIVNKTVILSDVTFNDIDLIRDSLKEIVELSISLSDTVNNNYFHLTGDNTISGFNKFSGTISVENLTSDNQFASNLCAIELSAKDLSSINGYIDNLSVGSLNKLSIIDKSITHTEPGGAVVVTYISTLQDVLDLSTETLIKKINKLSSDLSSDIQKLSSDLSGDIDKLSSDLSGDIQDLSTALSGDIDKLSNDLSGDIQDLSTALSGDIDKLSSDLSSDIQKLSSDLSGDIQALSTALSGDIDKLSSNLCAEILSIDTRYVNTFIEKDKTMWDGHISSDNLIITDPFTHIEGTEHKKYYMSFESGTLVLKPLN